MTTAPHATELHGFDPQQCAAEEAALHLGWLRECPYHGEPFRIAAVDPAMSPAQESATQNELRASDAIPLLATQVALAYGEQCPLCARESALPE